MFQRLLYVGLVCGFVLSWVGCSGSNLDLAEVKGKVTYKDAPVEGATVTFIPEKGPIATGLTDANGEFTLTTGGEPGAVIGECKVTISKTAASDVGDENMSPDDYAKMMSKPGASTGNEAPKNEIPPKYSDPSTSGLAKTVSSNASENVFEFALTD